MCIMSMDVHVCPPVLKAVPGYLWAGEWARQGEDGVNRTEQSLWPSPG